jgi:hypothetical protein
MRRRLVPDTNVLLHSLSLDQIPWREVMQCDEVEIVLVPQVLRELDAKKYGESERLKRRARSISAQLGKWTPSGTVTNAIAEGVTLTLVAREPAQRADLDITVPDDRVIASALSLVGDGAEVFIVTGDVLMRVKAEAHGLLVSQVPDMYRVRDEEPNKETTKRAQVSIGFRVDGADALANNTSLTLGLSAAHLLPEAQEMLARAPIPGQRGSGFLDLDSVLRFNHSSPPTRDEYARYVEEIRQYDVINKNFAELLVGVANDGDAPADDLVAEFWFPDNVLVNAQEPALPREPRPRNDFDLMAGVFRPPVTHPLDQNEFFRLWRSENTGRQCLTLRVARLMQKTQCVYDVWIEVPDETLRGFSIETVLRVASPPSAHDSSINVRLARG